MTLTADLVTLLQQLAGVFYVACQTGLLVYSSHRWPLLLTRVPGSAPPEPWWTRGAEPRVLVQLPVRDEPRVVERLVAAVAALEWPAGRLAVQVLDDSDDPDALAAGAAAVERARRLGVAVTHVRRASRTGYKAGALAYGLELDDAATGPYGSAGHSAEFVAVFDADFVPPPDFLRRMLPHLGAADVGLVQARWGHLNRDASLLTRAQAVMLDAHLLVEHPWRQHTRRFLNFNGTAGVWRRAAIDAAGGWSHDTLTEDLDLSYRAQLAGWRFVFEPAVVVPAELPERMSAFRSQQHRWAKGALQTARKLLPRILRAPLPWRVRLEAVVHLTANAGYPLLLALALLIAPVLFATHSLPLPWLVLLQLGVVALGTLPVALFLARGQQLAGRHGLRMAADIAIAIVLCAGLSWHLAGAVVAGLWGPTGEFVRTPKTGERARGVRDAARPGRHGRGVMPATAGVPELLLAAGFTGLAFAALAEHQPAAVPFPLALSAGLAWVGLATRARAADEATAG